MKSKANKHNRNKSGLLIALIFLFVGFAKGQNEYPITDPRNPNCPCHKYQKLADEEYKKLLGQNNAVKDKPVELVSNKNIGVSEDANEKLNKPIIDNKLIGTSDIGMNKNKEIFAFNDNPIGKINEDPSNPFGATKNGPGELNGSEQKISRSGSVERSPKYTTTKHWKGKRKKHTSFHKQLKRIFYVAGWDIWKRNRITSACYHWR